MRAHQAEFRIATMARVFGVSTSGYYAWLSCKERTLVAAIEHGSGLALGQVASSTGGGEIWALAVCCERSTSRAGR